MTGRSLPGLAIRRPVTIMMLLLTIIGMGVIAARRTPVEFMPPMDFPFLGVYIPYPGATPAQTEQEIAIPAEGEFQTLRGLREMFTHSDSNGCWIGSSPKAGSCAPTKLSSQSPTMPPPIPSGTVTRMRKGKPQWR